MIRVIRNLHGRNLNIVQIPAFEYLASVTVKLSLDLFVITGNL